MVDVCTISGGHEHLTIHPDRAPTTEQREPMGPTVVPYRSVCEGLVTEAWATQRPLHQPKLAPVRVTAQGRCILAAPCSTCMQLHRLGSPVPSTCCCFSDLARGLINLVNFLFSGTCDMYSLPKAHESPSFLQEGLFQFRVNLGPIAEHSPNVHNALSSSPSTA